MIDNPFEFGIVQWVRRWFSGDPNGGILDAEFERRILPAVETKTPMPECKEKSDAMALTLKNALDELQSSRAALIAVINQWGPITFAEETIEANKKKRISIKRENGFVKFSVEKSDNPATEWPDETRIDIIGANGNDGDHYAQG